MRGLGEKLGIAQQIKAMGMALIQFLAEGSTRSRRAPKQKADLSLNGKAHG